MTLRFGRAPARDVGRRQLLSGFLAFSVLAPSVSADAKTTLRISELIDGDGAALSQARIRAGEIVRLRGYFAPPLTAGQDYRLSESPLGPCQLCGAVHDAAALRVRLAVDGALLMSNLQIVDVTGRIETHDNSVRLVDASIKAA
jgi:hypothetical protein